MSRHGAILVNALKINRKGEFSFDRIMADLPENYSIPNLGQMLIPFSKDYQVLKNIVRRVHSTEKVNASLHYNLFSCG